MVVNAPHWRLTVDDYHRMAEVGILKEDDRVELIEGEIIAMTPIGPRHALAVNKVTRQLIELFPRDIAVISPQNPVVLGRRSEPQPDIALLRPPIERYAERNATPEDVLLLVEIADSSLDYDRGTKVGLYARSAIPEVWLADLKGEVVTIYRQPGPKGYRTIRIAHRGEQIAPAAFPDRFLAVDDLLA